MVLLTMEILHNKTFVDTGPFMRKISDLDYHNKRYLQRYFLSLFMRNNYS